MVITIVYDNAGYDPKLKTAWGYSCLVEKNGTLVLFDSGGDGATFLDNMRRLDIDERNIDAMVLSHPHGDHTEGIEALLDAGAHPIVYIPQSFSVSFKERVKKQTPVV